MAFRDVCGPLGTRLGIFGVDIPGGARMAYRGGEGESRGKAAYLGLNAHLNIYRYIEYN